MDCGHVKGGAEADGLREFGYAVVDDAVESLAPPVVVGDVEAGDSASLVDELGGLLIEGHGLDEVCGALFGWEAGVEPGLPGRLLAGCLGLGWNYGKGRGAADNKGG